MQYHHLASSWFLLQTGKKSVASQIEVNPNHWLLEPSLVATGVVVRWKWYQMGVRHINHYWATYLIFFFFLSLQWTSTEGLQSTLTYPEVVGQQNFSIVESPDPFGTCGEKGSGYARPYREVGLNIDKCIKRRYTHFPHVRCVPITSILAWCSGEYAGLYSN